MRRGLPAGSSSEERPPPHEGEPQAVSRLVEVRLQSQHLAEALARRRVGLLLQVGIAQVQEGPCVVRAVFERLEEVPFRQRGVPPRESGPWKAHCRGRVDRVSPGDDTPLPGHVQCMS